MRGLLRAGVAVVAFATLLFVLGVSATYAMPSEQAQAVHVVRRGETLASIALRYHTSVAVLKQANNLRNSNFIWTGQRLRIPGAAQPAKSALVSAPASSASPATSSGLVHRVRAGETLIGIAARYGISVGALMNANGLRNSNFVYTGQRLVIPGRQQAATPPSAVQPPAAEQPKAPVTNKRIVVSLSSQTAYAYEGGVLVYSTLVSTGRARTPTPVGKWKIYSKYRAQAMFGPGYYLPGVPNVMYFVGGYALHGTYWHNNFGHPMSHGCVNLSKPDAAWLYNWAPIGTEVVVTR